MTADRPDVLVVGAGVTGLTTAVFLAEAGHRVEVRSADVPDGTTSAAAGAMWSLYMVEAGEHIVRWSLETLAEMYRLADVPGTGVRLLAGTEAARREMALPGWVSLLPHLRRCATVELPAGFVSGYRYTVPVLEMPVHLRYLRERLHAAGGCLRLRPVESLKDATGDAPVVVNCTGISARDLADDPEVYPIRGQLVITANPGITEFFVEDTDDSPDLTYILPHGDTVTLGGSAESWRWELEPDPDTAAAIVARCAAVQPELATAPVLAHRVGLRPGRPTVRLEEAAWPGGGRLIHNYGHGGAGITLSWGCARATLDLIG